MVFFRDINERFDMYSSLRRKRGGRAQQGGEGGNGPRLWNHCGGLDQYILLGKEQDFKPLLLQGKYAWLLYGLNVLKGNKI